MWLQIHLHCVITRNTINATKIFQLPSLISSTSYLSTLHTILLVWKKKPRKMGVNYETNAWFLWREIGFLRRRRSSRSTQVSHPPAERQCREDARIFLVEVSISFVSSITICLFLHSTLQKPSSLLQY